MKNGTPSGQTRKNQNKYSRLARRILISWVICLIVGGISGSGITAIALHIKKAAAEPCETDGGQFFENEIPMEWDGAPEFKPLDCALPEDLQEFTYYLSTGYGIDFSYVMGLMFCESSFRIDCKSNTNDCGLMQINIQNHKWLSKELKLTDIEDPHQNIRAGLFILKKLFEKYEEPSKVAMAYNLGEYGASKLWKKGVFETSYSKKVIKKADEYKMQLENSIKK